MSMQSCVQSNPTLLFAEIHINHLNSVNSLGIRIIGAQSMELGGRERDDVTLLQTKFDMVMNVFASPANYVFIGGKVQFPYYRPAMGT